MKKLLMIVVIVFIFSTVGCNAKSSGIEVIITSDIHYLSESLYDNGEIFTRLMNEGDGRVIEYSAEVISAFLDNVIKEKPDALIISGDLTFNGEKQSHIELAQLLLKVEKKVYQFMLYPVITT